MLKFKANRSEQERKRAEKELEDTQKLSAELAGLSSVGVGGKLVSEDPPQPASVHQEPPAGAADNGNGDTRADDVEEGGSDNDEDVVPQTSPILGAASDEDDDDEKEAGSGNDDAAEIIEDDDGGAAVSGSEGEEDHIDKLHDSIGLLDNLAVGVQLNLKKPIDRYYFAAGELPTEEVELVYAKEGSGRPPAAREVRTDVLTLEVLPDAKFEGLPHQSRGGGRLPTLAQLKVNPWIKTSIDLIRDAWETGSLASYIARVHDRDLEGFLAEYKKEASTTVERLLTFLRTVAEEDIFVAEDDEAEGGGGKARAGKGSAADDDDGSQEEDEDNDIVTKLRQLPNGGAYITALKLPNGKIQAAASFQGEDGPTLTMRAWKEASPKGLAKTLGISLEEFRRRGYSTTHICPKVVRELSGWTPSQAALQRSFMDAMVSFCKVSTDCADPYDDGPTSPSILEWYINNRLDGEPQEFSDHVYDLTFLGGCSRPPDRPLLLGERSSRVGPAPLSSPPYIFPRLTHQHSSSVYSSELIDYFDHMRKEAVKAAKKAGAAKGGSKTAAGNKKRKAPSGARFMAPLKKNRK